MTVAMEFHDAKLLDLVCGCNGEGYILFHACIYKSDGVVFEDQQESGWQNFRMIFEGMRLEGTPVESGAYVSEGSLWFDAEVHDDVILLPAEHKGTIQVRLVVSPLFETLEVHAGKLSCQLEGPWELEHVWSLDEMTSSRSLHA